MIDRDSFILSSIGVYGLDGLNGWVVRRGVVDDVFGWVMCLDFVILSD